MKAIVLTFDAQIGFAELVVKRYARLWPDNPFQFLTPFQDMAAVPAALREAANVTLVRSPSGIRETMQALLDGIEDTEWVYWSIDDRYPTTCLNPEIATAVAREIRSGGVADALGVRLLRWREPLTQKARNLGGAAFRYQEPGSFIGFWQHHFVKAGVLRDIFLEDAPPGSYSIRALHERFLPQGRFRHSAGMLVPERSLMEFAEPCKRGRLVRGAADDLRAEGCVLPAYPLRDGHVEYNEARRLAGA